MNESFKSQADVKKAFDDLYGGGATSSEADLKNISEQLSVMFLTVINRYKQRLD